MRFLILALLTVSSAFAVPEVIRVIQDNVLGDRRTAVDFKGKVPLLSGFEFSFKDGDRHIQSIGIIPANVGNTILTSFRDGSNDDRYQFKYMATLVPANQVIRSFIRGRCATGGRCTKSIPRYSGFLALTGFKLEFTNGDHHINRISVQTYGHEVEIHFSDKDGGDPYDYEIHYAFVPESMIAERLRDSQPSNRGQGTGGIAAVEPTVLETFIFEFEAWTDNHLKAIGAYQEPYQRVTYNTNFSDNDGKENYSTWIERLAFRPD